jgi:hypothetical protein
VDAHTNKPDVDVYDINEVLKDYDTHYWQLTDSVDSLKYLKRGLKNAILRNSRKRPEMDEAAKPDYIDADGDGNEKESMKKAFADKGKSASYKTQVLWDADMKELQKDIKKIKQQHSKVEVSAVTRKGNGHQVTVKIFQDDTNESINELSDKEIDARWNTPQQRWQRQFNTSQMANDTKSSNVPNSGKSVEKAPSNFYREKLVALKAQRKQIEFDMEQEAEPEGGPIADYYGEALMHVDAQIEAIKDKMHTNESTLIKKAGIQEMREIPLEQRILRNLRGNDYILRETFKK